MSNKYPVEQDEKGFNKIVVRDVKEVPLLRFDDAIDETDVKYKPRHIDDNVRMLLPRQPLLIPPSDLPEKVKWSRANSVFKSFKEDTGALMDMCFDFDWRCSKIEHFLKKQLPPDGIARVY